MNYLAKQLDNALALENMTARTQDVLVPFLKQFTSLNLPLVNVNTDVDEHGKMWGVLADMEHHWACLRLMFHGKDGILRRVSVVAHTSKPGKPYNVDDMYLSILWSKDDPTGNRPNGYLSGKDCDSSEEAIKYLIKRLKAEGYDLTTGGDDTPPSGPTGCDDEPSGDDGVRTCSITGQDMTEGFMFFDSDIYIKDEKYLIAYLRKEYSDDIYESAEDLMTRAYEEGIYCWTTFGDDDEGEPMEDETLPPPSIVSGDFTDLSVNEARLDHVESALRIQELSKAVKSLGLPLVDVHAVDLPKDKVNAIFHPQFIMLTFWNAELDIQQSVGIEFEIHDKEEDRTHHEFYRVMVSRCVNSSVLNYESNPLYQTRIKHLIGSEGGCAFLSVEEVIEQVLKVLSLSAIELPTGGDDEPPTTAQLSDEFEVLFEDAQVPTGVIKDSFADSRKNGTKVFRFEWMIPNPDGLLGVDHEWKRSIRIGFFPHPEAGHYENVILMFDFHSAEGREMRHPRFTDVNEAMAYIQELLPWGPEGPQGPEGQDDDEGPLMKAINALNLPTHNRRDEDGFREIMPYYMVRTKEASDKSVIIEYYHHNTGLNRQIDIDHYPSLADSTPWVVRNWVNKANGRSQETEQYYATMEEAIKYVMRRLKLSGIRPVGAKRPDNDETAVEFAHALINKFYDHKLYVYGKVIGKNFNAKVSMKAYMDSNTRSEYLSLSSFRHHKDMGAVDFYIVHGDEMQCYVGVNNVHEAYAQWRATGELQEKYDEVDFGAIPDMDFSQHREAVNNAKERIKEVAGEALPDNVNIKFREDRAGDPETPVLVATFWIDGLNDKAVTMHVDFHQYVSWKTDGDIMLSECFVFEANEKYTNNSFSNYKDRDCIQEAIEGQMHQASRLERKSVREIIEGMLPTDGGDDTSGPVQERIEQTKTAISNLKSNMDYKKAVTDPRNQEYLARLESYLVDLSQLSADTPEGDLPEWPEMESQMDYLRRNLDDAMESIQVFDKKAQGMHYARMDKVRRYVMVMVVSKDTLGIQVEETHTGMTCFFDTGKGLPACVSNAIDFVNTMFPDYSVRGLMEEMNSKLALELMGREGKLAGEVFHDRNNYLIQGPIADVTIEAPNPDKFNANNSIPTYVLREHGKYVESYDCLRFAELIGEVDMMISRQHDKVKRFGLLKKEMSKFVEPEAKLNHAQKVGGYIDNINSYIETMVKKDGIFTRARVSATFTHNGEPCYLVEHGYDGPRHTTDIVFNLSEVVKSIDPEGSMTEAQTPYCRVCSVTGEGMNEGWIINDQYFKHQYLAVYEVENELNLPFDGGGWMDDDNYWTEWDSNDINELSVQVNGEWVELSSMHPVDAKDIIGTIRYEDLINGGGSGPSTSPEKDVEKVA